MLQKNFAWYQFLNNQKKRENVKIMGTILKELLKEVFQTFLE